MCKRVVLNGKCPNCWLPPTFMVGWRDEFVGKLVHDYKYKSTRAIRGALADLAEQVLPYVDGEVSLVPLPTIEKHIRERGFDHISLLARAIAKKRGWMVEKLLVRAQNTVQVGAGMTARVMQAVSAYEFSGTIKPERTYILVDDVWTTGASMKAAIKKLQRAGASKIIVLVLAVNRVDHN